MKVAFLTPTLERAGAERQLVAVACSLRRRGHDVEVVTLYRRRHSFEAVLRREGVSVRALLEENAPGWKLLLALPRLIRTLRREHPDVVHAYLTLPNILAVLLRPFARRVPVAMGILATAPEREPTPVVRLVYRLEAVCSRFASAIFVNSRASRSWVVGRGFPANRVHTVLTGIDTDEFAFDPEGRATFRAEWGVDDDEILIGRVGGLRPIKDHPTFLRAAAVVAKQRPDARFVVIGSGDGSAQQPLEHLARDLGFGDRVVWAGPIDAMPQAMSALDLLVSSSKSESFPNVLGEAMACGVPCVTTDVGDSVLIVGDVGEAVPPGSPEELAGATLRLLERLEREPDELRRLVRERVVEHFGCDRMVDETEARLLRLAGR